MKVSTVKWLTIAAALVVIGALICAAMFIFGLDDEANVNSRKFETNTHEISEKFSDISINTDTADIIFKLSDDGRCIVECYEEEKAKHDVFVDGGKLSVEINDKREWHDYIGFGLKSPTITIYFPMTELGALLIDESTGDIDIPRGFAFESIDITMSTGSAELSSSASGDVSITATTGDITVRDITAGKMALSVSTGEINVDGVKCGEMRVDVTTGEAELCDIECESLISSGHTGDIEIIRTLVDGALSITRSTGHVKFDRIDADDIYIKTSTGDVLGSILSKKIFITDTSTGKIDVPSTSEGGRCEIRTSTGDIRVRIE